MVIVKNINLEATNDSAPIMSYKYIIYTCHKI